MMTMTTPRSEQGQMVEHSYGWHEGSLYRRTFDRSDRTEAWHRADEDSAAELPEGYSAGGEDGPPEVEEWIPCAAPAQS